MVFFAVVVGVDFFGVGFVVFGWDFCCFVLSGYYALSVQGMLMLFKEENNVHF